MRTRPTFLAAVTLLLACGEPATSPSVPPPAQTPPVILAPPPGSTLMIKEDLGVLPGTTTSDASAINAARQIVGTSGIGGSGRAFVWTPPGPMVNLGTLPEGGGTSGNDINGAGQVAGDGSGVGWDAFRWTPPGPIEVLAGPGFDQFGFGINDAGVVAGSAEDPAQKPFLWDGPTAIALPDLGGGFGWASDIADDGGVVGTSADGADELHAFYWTEAGGIVDLGTLPGGDESSALALSSDWEIVGHGTDVGGMQRAVRWASPASPAQDLGTLGGAESGARDLNATGVIAGWAENAAGFSRAFRRKAGAAMVDLGTLGGDESRAEGVSGAGHVVGWAELPSGNRHAVAWWHYLVDDALLCDCPPPDPPINIAAATSFQVVVPSGGRLDARAVDPSTLTLGDGDGDDAPVARRRGEPLAFLRDVDRDGDLDLVVVFDTRDLLARGDLSRETTSLFLLAALRDRSNAVYGDIAVKVVPRGRGPGGRDAG